MWFRIAVWDHVALGYFRRPTFVKTLMNFRFHQNRYLVVLMTVDLAK